MDPNLQRLAEAFKNSVAHDANTRNQASEILIQARNAPGCIAAVLQLVLMPDLPEGIRQAAAILAKNLAEQRWKPTRPDVPPLGDDEKAFVRSCIVEAVVASPKIVRMPLELVMREACADYPEHWSDLGEKIMSLLNSNDMVKVNGALICVRQLFRSFEWVATTHPRREVLHNVVGQLFPFLGNLFEYVLTLTTPEVWDTILSITKIFWSASQYVLPPYLAEPQSFHKWAGMLTQVLKTPEPALPQLQQMSSRTREQQSWWKCVFWAFMLLQISENIFCCLLSVRTIDHLLGKIERAKKWVAHLICRLINRYGSRKSGEGADHPNSVFGVHFMGNYALPLLEVVMTLLHQRTRNIFLPDRFVVVLLGYLNHALFYSTTWVALKPHVEAVFRDVMFPMLMFTERNWDDFNNDPVEYIRLQTDPYEETYLPHLAVTQFIIDLVKYRKKEFLIMLMNFVINEVGARYLNSPPDQRNPREKYAVLDVLVGLSGQLKRSQNFGPELERIVVTHVIPELRSSHAWLAGKACQTVALFYNISWSTPQHYINALSDVLSHTTADCLPLQFQAAVSVQDLISPSFVRDIVRSDVPNLLKVYFDLIDEIDSERLVSAMQTVLALYPSESMPFAMSVVQRFAETFNRLVNTEADPDDDTTLLTAIQIFGAVSTLCDAMQHQPAMFSQIEPYVIPMMNWVLDSEQADFIEDVARTLCYITLHSVEISANIWQFFPKIVHVLSSWGTDYMPEFLATLDNFVSRSTQQFLTSGALDMLLNLYHFYVANEKRSEYEAGQACQLMEVVLVYCKGQVDNVVPGILEIAMQRLKSAETEALKVLLLEVAANSMHYNPMLAFSYLDSKGYLGQVFDLWLKMAKKKNSAFTRLHDKRVSILGLSSVFSVPFDPLPNHLKNKFLPILLAILKQQLEAEEQRLEEEMAEEEDAFQGPAAGDVDGDDEDISALRKAFGKGQESSTEEEDDDDNGDDGDVDADDFAMGGNEERAFDDGEAHGDNEDVDEFYEHDEQLAMLEKMAEQEVAEFDLDDDVEFESALDKIEVSLYFMEVFHGWGNREGGNGQALLAELNPKQHKQLNQVSEIAMARKQAHESQPN